jgi:hypothetical protein
VRAPRPDETSVRAFRRRKARFAEVGEGFAAQQRGDTQALRDFLKDYPQAAEVPAARNAAAATTIRKGLIACLLNGPWLIARNISCRAQPRSATIHLMHLASSRFPDSLAMCGSHVSLNFNLEWEAISASVYKRGVVASLVIFLGVSCFLMFTDLINVFFKDLALFAARKAESNISSVKYTSASIRNPPW